MKAWVDEETEKKKVERDLEEKKKALVNLRALRDAECVKWEAERKRLTSSRKEVLEADIALVACSTLAGRVGVFRTILEDRLVFPTKALKSLDACPRDMEKYVLPALFVLYTRFWPAFVEQEEQGTRLEHLVDDLVFNYSSNETGLTMTSAEYVKARTVTYNGVEYKCFKHLKMKRGDGRVYFEFDGNLKKIVLCSIGPHLDTAGTKRRGH